MGIEKVVLYSTSDRADQAGKVVKYTISGQNFQFILYQEMGWKALYEYLRSVAKVEELKAVPD